MTGQYNFLECMSANHKKTGVCSRRKRCPQALHFVNGRKVMFPTVYLSRMFGRVDATVYLQNCVNTCED